MTIHFETRNRSYTLVSDARGFTLVGHPKMCPTPRLVSLSGLPTVGTSMHILVNGKWWTTSTVTRVTEV